MVSVVSLFSVLNDDIPNGRIFYPLFLGSSNGGFDTYSNSIIPFLLVINDKK